MQKSYALGAPYTGNPLKATRASMKLMISINRIEVKEPIDL